MLQLPYSIPKMYAINVYGQRSAAELVNNRVVHHKPAHIQEMQQSQIGGVSAFQYFFCTGATLLGVTGIIQSPLQANMFYYSIQNMHLHKHPLHPLTRFSLFNRLGSPHIARDRLSTRVWCLLLKLCAKLPSHSNVTSQQLARTSRIRQRQHAL